MNPVGAHVYHEPTCGICRDEYKVDQPNACLITKCKHIFHESCLNDWLKIRPICPMCNKRTILPLLTQESFGKLILQEGTRGAVAGAKYVAWGLAALIFIGIEGVIIDTALGRDRRVEQEKLEMLIKQNGASMSLDLRTGEGLVKLTLFTLSIMFVVSVIFIAKSLYNRPTHHPDDNPYAPTKIKYIPPANQ